MTTSPFQNVVDSLKKHIGEASAPNSCANFVTTGLSQAGLGAALAGCENVNYVPTLFSYGEKERLTSTTAQGVPPVGSLVSVDKRGHVMMVSEVLPDGRIKIIEGNWSHKVGERTLSLSEIDPVYISADKMRQKLIDKGVPLPKLDPSVVNQQTAAVASEMTTPDPATGKPPSLTEIYDKHKDEADKSGMGGMIMQLVVALLMMLSNKSDMIPSQQQYKDNPDIGRQRLEQIDKERALGQSQAVASAQPGTDGPLTPTATPNVTATIPRVPQLS